jgi:hypothetical protein
LIKIQKRDQKLLFGLSKYGVLSTLQIANWYFQNVDRHTVLRRLRLLKSHNLILNPSTLPDGTKAWSLSKTGAAYINAATPIRHSNRNATLHDVSLAALRKCLEESIRCHSWTSDMEMKRELGCKKGSDAIVPDGLFVAEIFKQPAVIALELELHAKSHARYKNIFEDYFYRSAINYVFYIVANDSIKRPILKCWNAIQRKYHKNVEQKLLIANFDEVLKNKHSAMISVLGKSTFPLQEVFTESSACPPPMNNLEHPLGNLNPSLLGS